MANSNILESYLISLGFGVDQSSLSRFNFALRDASNLVDSTTLSTVKSFFRWQVAITGGFAAAGAAALGIVDKVAMADQEYRLFALRLYTTTNTARSLKVAMDALGQPLENIAWDPELAHRFAQLIQDQRALTTELGPSFEAQMIKIRDLRFEFSRFGVELQYLTMNVVANFGKVFGVDADGILLKMRSFNTWFINHMPEISDWIVKTLKPAVGDIKTVLGDTKTLMLETGIAFTNLVGALSGDKSIEGTSFSFEHLSIAIQHVMNMMTKFIVGIISVEKILLHIASAASLLASGKFSDALTELKLAGPEATPLSLAVIGGLVGTAAGGPLGGAAGAGLGALAGKVTNDLEIPGVWGMMSAAVRQIMIKNAIEVAAEQIGVDPALAQAVAQHESQYTQFGANGLPLVNRGTPDHHSQATGIFQLEPGTAHDMGVDPNTVEGNITGGVKLLHFLLGKYKGNEAKALEAYYGNTWQPGANQAFAKKIMEMQAGINIENMEINVSGSHLTHEQIKKATSEGVMDAAKQRQQKWLQEFDAWMYTGN